MERDLLNTANKLLTDGIQLELWNDLSENGKILEFYFFNLM